jgi:hypothetical protein
MQNAQQVLDFCEKFEYEDYKNVAFSTCLLIKKLIKCGYSNFNGVLENTTFLYTT